jgi:host factor-I protein
MGRKILPAAHCMESAELAEGWPSAERELAGIARRQRASCGPHCAASQADGRERPENPRKGKPAAERVNMPSGFNFRRKEMSERQNLQDQFLNTLRKEHVHCSVFLVNGIKLVGRIESFDQYMVLLRGNDQAVQAIFKHAISTISPAKQVAIGPRDSGEPAE